MATSTAESELVRGTIETFSRDGLALVESVLTAAELDAARRGVEHLMGHGPAKYRWIKQYTYEHYPEHPIFVALLEHPLVIAFARGLIGADFHVIAAQCSRNTREDPYAPGAMNIHQDEVFFPPAGVDFGPEPYRGSFSAMWYLQDTPLEMGPTELVVGSHTGAQKFVDGEIEPGRLWRRAVPAGSLLLFSHHTWHRGALNGTDRPRDLITNAYARREVAKCQLTKRGADGEERYEPCEGLLAGASEVVRRLLRA